MGTSKSTRLLYSAAMKSELSSGTKQEATNSMVSSRPVHVHRSCPTTAGSSSSATTSTTISGVKRKASSDMLNKIFAATPRRGYPSVTAADIIRPEDSELFSDLSDNSTDTCGTSDKRIKSCNSYAIEIDTPRVNARHSRQRPAKDLYIKMVVGPKVKIVVGPEKESFELPKDLLSYYSPVFDRSFNGKFMEGQTQIMELPEDNVEDFEVLVEYVFHHSVGDKLSISRHGLNAAERCISFLKYADMYDLGDVSSLVYDALRPVLIEGGPSAFKSSFIEVVFSLTKDGNCLRALMADAALSFQGEYVGIYPNNVKIRFEKQEAEVEGFGLALYRQLKKPGILCVY